jgi:hypothetical protein
MISCIDGIEFEADAALESSLREYHDTNPPQAI